MIETILYLLSLLTIILAPFLLISILRKVLQCDQEMTLLMCLIEKCLLETSLLIVGMFCVWFWLTNLF